MVKLSEVLKCKCKLKNFHMVSTLLLLSPLSLLNDEMCSLKPRVSEKKKKMSIRRVPFHRESHVDLNSIHLFFSCSIYVQTWHRKRKVLKEQKSGVILTSTGPDFQDVVFHQKCCTGGLQRAIIFFVFLMENSILKLSGSVDVKIISDFCS